MRTGSIALVLAWFASNPTPLRAETRSVGPGATFATPCAAVAAASAGDVIEIAAGTYTDSCAIALAGLTLRGVGGRPKIDLSGTDHPAQYKGIYVIAADDITIENLELSGAHITADNGENAAALRVEAKGLTVRNCYLHDNQNGILGGTTGTLTIEYTEFANNAIGDGCNGGGCTHNVYVSGIDALYFRYNWSHRLATDTPDKGHLLKSRAKANYILYNRLSGEDGFDSYEIDLPNGGLAVVVGNVVQKGAQSGNGTLLSWGAEGASNADKRVFIVHNTFVKERSSGAFLNVSGATLSLHNNIFAGPGAIGISMTLSADNLAAVDPVFVDRATFDFHLRAESPARGKAVDPGMADQMMLVPAYEYAHPTGRVTRTKVDDLGAFEFATDPEPDADAGAAGMGGRSGAGGRAAQGGRSAAGAGAGGSVAAGSGGASGRAGAGGAGSGGEMPAADGGDGSGKEDSSGCSCDVPGASRRSPPSFGLVWLLSFWLFMRLRRRLGVVAAASVLLIAGCAGESKSGSRAGAGAGGAGGGAGRDAASGDDDAGQAGSGAVAAPAAGGGSGGAGAGGRASAGSGAAGSGGATAVSKFCPDLGWCELPGTQLASVCPDADRYADIQANEGCSGVINDWSGGLADTRRNRLLVWGGGHRGYFGNELYALDLVSARMLRLNEPSDVTGVDLAQCTPPEAYADGRPSSRHTYDGLALIAHADKMFTLAGSGIPCGYGLRSTWTLDLAAIESAPVGGVAPWMDMKPALYPTKAAFGVVADYDPESKRVILNDGYNLWSYELEANAYRLLNDSNATDAHIDYHMTGRVDPKRGLFVAIGGGTAAGGGMQVFDIRAGYAQQNWTDQVTGCTQLLAANSPGWAYDSERERLVGWAGGDTVYSFDPDTKRCETSTHAGGPGAQHENGTFGRFRYFPELRVFAVVNAFRANAFVLRLAGP